MPAALFAETNEKGDSWLEGEHRLWQASEGKQAGRQARRQAGRQARRQAGRKASRQAIRQASRQAAGGGGGGAAGGKKENMGRDGGAFVPDAT